MPPTAVPEAEPSAAAAASSGAADSNDTTGPSPYGTRSRNRNGNSRPNYAEDRENEMDYEFISSKKSRASVESTSAAQVSEGEKTVTHSRRGAGNAGAAKASSATASASSQAQKDSIPGTSTFAVNGDSPSGSVPQTRKRKAPGVGAAQSAANNSSPATTRKGSYHLAGHANRDTCMVTFDDSGAFLQNGVLVADDKTRFSVNDTVYLVCEPPGEPYYVARIMEFQHAGNTPKGKVESIRINWIYRPRDIGRKATDTRLVFASMHSDFCPLTSLRGKCQVLHRSKISNLDSYRKTKDCFYYNQMYERYIHRYYDVIPTELVINVPEKVKKVLDERWEFVIVESGRAKELTSAIKTCKRCAGYCANHDSVDCAMCKNTYHMNCVQPPLLKKPARGFAWSCGPCSRKQERRLEARNTPLVGEDAEDVEMDDVVEEEEERNPSSNTTTGNSPATTQVEHPEATKEQLAQAKLWPYRYLGIHCKVEDALDYDDRIYPRASSRLGPRHQANVPGWYGHHVEYVKSSEGRKKWGKGQSHKKDAPKLSKEAIAALEAEKNEKEKRPKWILDAPPGYVRRGEDIPNSDSQNTAKLIFRLPEVGETSSRGEDDRRAPEDETERAKYEADLEAYMNDAKDQASSLGLADYNTNYLDKALEYYYAHNFDRKSALKQLQTVDSKRDLKEPKLSKEEQRRFEEGVARYGSNLGDVSRHVGKSQKHGDIVRYYYVWKKTASGEKIWGSYEGRKGKKQSKQADSTALLDDVADDFDDSAFDNDKIVAKKRGFECKYCATKHSRVWRRAPQTAPGTTVVSDSSKGAKDKSSQLMVALCQRCASLWRKYALQYESMEELTKRVGQTGGRAFRKKQDEELLTEVAEANKAAGIAMTQASAAAAHALGIDIPASLIITPEQDAARKKARLAAEKEREAAVAASVQPIPFEAPKKKAVEKPPESALVPEQPKFTQLPCAVCLEREPIGDDYFCCRSCRLTVHRNCYGIPEGRSPTKWTCEMCMNDQSNQYSTTYECVLCPRKAPEVDLYEAPKPSHKKKTDREREKERLEKELVVDATKEYRRKQTETGKPTSPREPLKPTSGNKWVHVTCAVWVQGIKFYDPRLLDKAEGIMAIPHSSFGQTCRVCKSSKGVCVTCHKCPTTFHVTCAQHQPVSAGYVMGFDVTPVKSTRRDVVDIVTLGNEKGYMEPVVFCREHGNPKTVVHPISEPAENNLNALQLYVRHFKQADSSLTGTVRKADMVTRSRSMTQTATANGHRASLSNAPSTPTIVQGNSLRASPEDVTVKSEEVDEEGDRVVHLSSIIMPEPVEKECISCRTNSSPKWYKRPRAPQVNGFSDSAAALDGRRGSINDYVCHRCQMRKKEPTPPSRPAEVVTRPPTAETHVPPPPHIPPAAGWPHPGSQPPGATPHPPHPGQLPPGPGHAQPIVNGVAHTPPPPQHAVHPGQPPSPYMPPGPGRPYFPNGYDGRPPSSSAPGGPPPPHPPNSSTPVGPPIHGPPPPNYPHRPNEAPYHYPPPPPPHGSPHYVPNGSPHTAAYHLPHGPSGPAGPPRPDSNPFATMPRSPGQAYAAHGSPRPRTGDRQEVPVVGNGRMGWDREREEREREGRERREREDRERREREGDSRRTPTTATANGASANPSLRNLIHGNF